ncbi:MAG: RNA 2',3'-cyclic phosphodiesterase [Bacteroidales bacterium]|nr:RNA 2',3'-cyclic phosphodiesterase [Bacteroidales bacterium]
MGNSKPLSQRLFIAIKPEITPEFSEKINLLKSLAGYTQVKWVSEQNLHLTLYFLGNTPQIKVPAVKEAVLASVAGLKPFGITLKGFGTFGNLRQRVIWAGVGNSATLSAIAVSLKQNLESVGFVTDNKAFLPHLTIARVKYFLPTKPFGDFIAGNKNTILQRSQINKVFLFESLLKPAGPEYYILESFSLY